MTRNPGNEPSDGAEGGPRRLIVVVLGMHRSGTSVITRGLETLGVSLGDRLMQPVAANNEKGFFEDLDIYTMNERLLRKAGSAWYKLTRLDKAMLAGPGYSQERRDASALLSEKISSANGIFGFKDPRTALLLPFWQCVFDDLNLAPRYVLAVRNPLEAAASLQARDGIALERGLLLWANHTIDAVADTTNDRRVFVNFDRMFDDAPRQLARIADALDLPGPDPAATEIYQQGFVSAPLRHNRIGVGELRRSALGPAFVAELHDLMQNAADDRSEIDESEFAAIQARHADLVPMLAYVDAGEDALAELRQARDEAAAQAVAANAALEAVTDEVSAIRAEVSGIRTEVSGVRAELDQRARVSETLTEKLQGAKSELQQVVETLNAKLRASDERADQAEIGRAEAVSTARTAQEHADTESAKNETLGNRLHLETEANRCLAAELGEERARLTALERQADLFAREGARLKTANDIQIRRAAAESAEAREKIQKAVTESARAREEMAATTRAAQEDAARLRAELERAVSDAAELRRTTDTIASSRHAIRRHEQTIHEQRAALVSRDQELAALRARVATLSQQYRDSRRDLLLARASLTEMRQSTSWRLSAPLRAASTAVRNPGASLRSVAIGTTRRIWRALPMNVAQRHALKTRAFTSVPALFSSTNAYRAWKQQSETKSAPSEEEHGAAIDPSLEGYVLRSATQPPNSVQARAIAFYLPQFHPIPENDAWWGEGFTEWTKVRAATPRFSGHYQPHEPDELGYYDLLETEGILERQAELARAHGLSGFCFYFYWFAGKRLLEAPLQQLMRNPHIDMPFCLCWANENWSRRWDGKDHEILIGQKHSAQDDIAFIAHVSQYFGDKRHIRVDGKPLLVIYRPDLLPSAKATTERWRRWLAQNGFGDVYLAYTQSFSSEPPEAFGCDAAIEFPPNNTGVQPDASLIREAQSGTSLAAYDWRAVAARPYGNPSYKLFRSVNPSWDNTARRQNDGAVFVNASPAVYRAWLQRAVRDTRERFANQDERLIFINAWNEWAEGAHLEPDKRYGFAWLEATRQALDPTAQKRKVIVVTHDMHRHGAQFIALNLARSLQRHFGFQIATIAIVDGVLAENFREVGPVHILDQGNPSASADAIIERLAAQGFTHAIVNSAASAWIASQLKDHDIDLIGLVHELPSVIETMRLAPALRSLDEKARAVVFPAGVVRDRDAEALHLPGWKNAAVQPQGLYQGAVLINYDEEREAARRRILAQLKLPEHAQIVLGVGWADFRKGVDIFLDWAIAAIKRWPNVHFVWAGAIDPDLQKTIHRKLAGAGALRANIHFPGFVTNPRDLYLASSVYALCSREDPFPSTALEAMAAATPVVMIAGTGGIEELAETGAVAAVASASAGSFLEAAEVWLSDARAARVAGLRGRDVIRERFGSTSYAGAIADQLGVYIADISVVVPNYNYAHHLEERLNSILEQSLAPREIIFLDDASIDGSVAVAERILRNSPINWRVIRNERNSGSVFAQWRKGVELARGDLVWIAEADDFADRRFLEVASAALRRRDVAMSFTQSRQISGDGALLAPDYLDYVQDVSPEKWRKAFVSEGDDEVREGFSVKNTAPNVSAALFRRAVLSDVLRDQFEEIGSYRVAGDWCVYVNVLRHGALAFSPAPLNAHRRHDESVTISKFGLSELAEIARMQAYVAREFGTPHEYSVKARAYLERLVDQFGLGARYGTAEIAGALRGVVAA